jgi:anti-anti-sigma factor
VVISDAMQELAKNKRMKVLMNLARDTYQDSCGIGHLVRAIATARRLSIDLKLANAAAPVFALLRMTHLERIVDITDSEATGIAAFGKVPAKKK